MEKLKFVTENGFRFTKYWLGPFAGAIDVHHPDAVRTFLKGSGIILFLALLTGRHVSLRVHDIVLSTTVDLH